MFGFNRRRVLLCLLLVATWFAQPTGVVGQEPPGGAEQPPPAADAPTATEAFPVAVLRLDKIFKDNVELQSRLAPLKVEAAELEKTIQVRQSEIENTQARLTRVQQGSSEFEKLQLQLARLRTELQLFVNRERQKLLEREGQAYLAVYRDVEAVVTAYCKERGIRLVLRHQEGVDGSNPDPKAVLAALNRGIVYADNLDITEDIARLVAERARPARR